jgi:DNA-directed RNA polymerase subunit RPC12/RpoP
MLPYITTHPNVCNYINGEIACTYCGEVHNFSKIENHYYYTNLNKYQVYRCNTCGGVFRDRKSIKNMPKVL